MRERRWRGGGLALIVVVASGCFVGAPDPGASIACANDADCPAPLTCVADRGACFSLADVAGERCGDGFVAASGTEECDNGDANSDVTPDACRTTCTAPRCGDGVKDSTETCDDGNDADGDTCPAGCIQPFCGDGILAPQEICDDGNLVSGDGCRGDCQKAEACDDLVVDVGEDCDDGNDNPADGCDACRAVTWAADVITGRGGEGGLAVDTALRDPSDVDVGADGSVYIVDAGQFRIVRVDDTGFLSVVAGTGQRGLGGNGGLAIAAQLDSPSTIAVDADGRVFFVDDGGKIVRVIQTDGTIEVFAGVRGAVAGSGNDGPATQAGFSEIFDIAVDGLGNLLIVDIGLDSVRRVGRDGIIRRFLGPGGSDFQGASRLDFRLAGPQEVVVEADGNVVVTDPNAGRAYRVRGDRAFFVLGLDSNQQADGGLALDSNLAAFAIASDAQGLWVLDEDDVLWRIIDGRLHRQGGGGALPVPDTTDITLADLSEVFAIEATPDGDLLLVETRRHRVLRLDRTGALSVFAGTGAVGFVGVGGPATSATLRTMGKADRDSSGRLLVGDDDTLLIYRVEVDGTLAVVAGGGREVTEVGETVPARAVRFFSVDDVVADDNGGFSISDFNADVVYHVDADGQATIVLGEIGVGITDGGARGDGGPATAAHVSGIIDMAADAQDRLLIADTFDCRVRRIGTDGIINTVAGSGACRDDGDGGLATNANVDPVSVAVASDGRIAIGTRSGFVRVIDADGRINTVAGDGSTFRNDGVLAVDSDGFADPFVAWDADNRLVIGDDDGRLFRIDPVSDRLALIAGGGLLLGDGGLAVDADLGFFRGLQTVGNEILVTDIPHRRVRSIDQNLIVTTALGDATRVDVGPVARASLARARDIVVVDGGAVLAAGGNGRLLRVQDGTVDIVGGRDGGEPISATARAVATVELLGPMGGMASAGETVWMAETNRHRILEVQASGPAETWTVRVLAGGVAGADNGPIAAAGFRSPMGLVADEAGTALFVADRDNQVIRRIDLVTQTVTTVAGRVGFRGVVGDGRAATLASLADPEAVAIGADGSIFIADTGNNRVRRVDSSGVITTVLGDGTPSSSGEGAPARDLPIEAPRGLVVDAFGNLMATTPNAIRLVAANDDGVVDGSGPVQTIYGRPPRASDPERLTRCLGGLAIDPTADDQVLVVDTCIGFLVSLTRQ